MDGKSPEAPLASVAPNNVLLLIILLRSQPVWTVRPSTSPPTHCSVRQNSVCGYQNANRGIDHRQAGTPDLQVGNMAEAPVRKTAGRKKRRNQIELIPADARACETWRAASTRASPFASIASGNIAAAVSSRPSVAMSFPERP